MTLLLRRLWSGSPALTAAGLSMLPALAISLGGLILDPTIITGVPAWLKPAKFAISTAIYAFTLAWIFSYLTDWPTVTRITGWLTAAVLVLEVAIIDVQAARGVTSHFNVATPLDAALFGFMGLAILILWIAAVFIAVALFRQHFDNPAWGWSLRLGMLITVLGAGLGGVMTTPTSAQSMAARQGNRLVISGAHTVGAPDGGPGLPGTGWSMQHGDLRVPHFIGLHALQIIPLLGWVCIRFRRPVTLVWIAAASYFTFWAILTWQALRGQSVVAPDRAALEVFALWAAATVVSAGWAGSTRRLL